MQEAWQAEASQTTAQLLAAVNGSRTKRNSRHISHTGVAKALDQLQRNGFLTRDKSGPGFAVFHVNMSREQYVASAIQSLSQSVLRKSIADIFPALIGARFLKPKSPEQIDAMNSEELAVEGAKVAQQNFEAAEEIETLARVIADPSGSPLQF